LWAFKNHVLLREKKKGLKKLTLVTSVFFFSGKFSQLSEGKKEKKKGKVEKIYYRVLLRISKILGYFLFPPSHL
jgi:hypothetical protein